MLGESLKSWKIRLWHGINKLSVRLSPVGLISGRCQRLTIRDLQVLGKNDGAWGIWKQDAVLPLYPQQEKGTVTLSTINPIEEKKYGTSSVTDFKQSWIN